MQRNLPHKVVMPNGHPEKAFVAHAHTDEMWQCSVFHQAFQEVVSHTHGGSHSLEGLCKSSTLQFVTFQLCKYTGAVSFKGPTHVVVYMRACERAFIINKVLSVLIRAASCF